jgi:hypothetical protein
MNWITEISSLLGLGRKSLLERWSDRLLQAVELAAGSLEGMTERAVGAADEARRRGGPQLREARERARSGVAAGRGVISERVDAIAQRAAEIRERRERRREARRESRRRRRRPRYRTPMQLDLRRDDRIVLRGRRPLDLRLPGGGVIRYRYYERPTFAQRLYFHFTGRRIWPPR